MTNAMLQDSAVPVKGQATGSFLKRKAGNIIEEMVRQAGIRMGEEMIVHDPGIWSDWAARGMLAIGETYMQKKWDSPCVDVVMSKLVNLPREAKDRLFNTWRNKLLFAAINVANPQRPAKELQIARQHYNLGNEFFNAWLDPHMQYSCAYWKGARTLEEAQENKMHMIAKKLKLEPGMRVLDIGCGWGGLGRFLIKEYGVKVTGVNISSEQMKWCRDKACEETLQDSFECMETSYRNIKGKWDRIVVVGMIEHVGPRNYQDFFTICRNALTDDGLLLLQTIGSNRSWDVTSDRWVTTYIFPNSCLPSIAQLAKAVEKGLIIEDIHNLGADYAQTLRCWYERFQDAQKELKLSETFIRMWEFFLLYSISGFEERKTQLWQVVMSKKHHGRYDAAR